MEDLASTFPKELDLTNQIISERNSEIQEQLPARKIDIVQTTKVNLEQLGIYMSQEGPKSPCCGKTKSKRGRKSLKELRESEGLSKD